MHELYEISQEITGETDAAVDLGLDPTNFVTHTQLTNLIAAGGGGIYFIKRPDISVDYTNNILTITGDQYTTSEYFTGQHVSTVIEIASDILFTNILNTYNLGAVTQHTINNYVSSTDFYVRMRYTSVGETSIWSPHFPVYI